MQLAVSAEMLPAWTEGDRDRTQRNAVGLLRFCRMSQWGYLAVNMCYSSREGKNGLEYKSEIIKVIGLILRDQRASNQRHRGTIPA